MKHRFPRTLLAVLLLSITLPAISRADDDDPRSGEVPRAAIASQYKWNLTPLFADEASWQTEHDAVRAAIASLPRERGELQNSPAKLLAALQRRDALQTRVNRLRIYAKCLNDVAVGQSENVRRSQLAAALERELETAAAPLEAAVRSTTPATRAALLEREPALRPWARWMERIAAPRGAELPDETRKLLDDAAAARTRGRDIWTALIFREIPFGEVAGPDGQPLKASPGQARVASFSQDRAYRERSYRNVMESYGRFRTTMATLVVDHMRQNVFQARARGYTSVLEWRMADFELPPAVYENLIATVRANLTPVHRWIALKKNVLGVDAFQPWDTNVSLFPSVDRRLSWEEAVDLNRKAVAPLGAEYHRIIDEAFANGWVDAFPHPGKEGGNYSSGAHPGIHPFVKMNFRGSMGDATTLVHEMGHMVHATKVIAAQPPVDAGYMPFMGEIASTTPEVLAHNKAAADAVTPAERMYYLEQHINNLQLLLYSATMGAEFEKRIYERLERDEPVTADDLDALYLQLSREYWGPDMAVDELERHGWFPFQHWFLNYYMFSYATSMAASEQFAARIAAEGEPAARDFAKFLEAGRSAPPLDILRASGVDLATPAPIEAAARQMDRLVSELETLLASQSKPEAAGGS